MKKAPVGQRSRDAAVCSANLLHHNLRLVTVYTPVDQLKPPSRALRKHGKRQLAALKASITEFGILKPILIDPEGTVRATAP